SYCSSHNTAPTEPYTLSLHDALPISDASALPGLVLAQPRDQLGEVAGPVADVELVDQDVVPAVAASTGRARQAEDVGAACHPGRSEEHTSELQSLAYLVCRLLLEKKK